MSQETSQAQPEPEKTKGAAPPEVDIWGVLRYCLVLLQAQSWQALGLVSDPATGKIKKDLAQAKVAIDAVGYLAQQLEVKLSGAELRELQHLVADLKMNFVNQQKGEAEANPAPPD